MSGGGLTSIIIPTYNGLHLLRPCVEAIRRHTEVPYEIIVVDNGSDDETAQFCLREKLILAALPRNEGFPAAVNRGLLIASGEQLLVMNNDVIVAPGWLSNMLAALGSADDVGLVGPVTNYASGRRQVAVLGRIGTISSGPPSGSTGPIPANGRTSGAWWACACCSSGKCWTG